MTRQVGKLLKAILILPVNVLIVIPALILFFSDDRRELPSAGTAVLGGLFFCVGLFLVVSTMRLFWKEGLGTPAPWSPPSKLVVEGPYRHVRNPMISGVLFILMAEVCFFLNNGVALWFLLFALINAVYIPLVEEKGLEKRFGKSYLIYKENVPRWIPRLLPWKG